jgi:hypothetical protein
MFVRIASLILSVGAFAPPASAADPITRSR